MKLDNYECDGQMSIFDLQPKEETTKHHPYPCDDCIKDEVPQRKCDTDPVKTNCKEKVSNTGWNDWADTKPPQNLNVEIEYLWTMHNKNDRKGICEGWWNGKNVCWVNMPFDIGKKEIVAWRYIKGDIIKLTLDNLRPCDCGYSGRKAVAYVGCGTPINGYTNGRPVYEHFLFSIFCPECHRTATEKYNGWKSNKTDKQEAMKDWQENPLKLPTVEGNFWFDRFAEKMDETVELFDGFV